MDEEHTFEVVVGVDGSPQSLLALEWGRSRKLGCATGSSAW